VSYEAASAFEPAHRVVAVPDGSPPLVWAGIFDRSIPAAPRQAFEIVTRENRPAFAPMVDAEAFKANVLAVQDLIRDGDVYQVNVTFPMTVTTGSDVDDWYEELRRSQRARYCARIDIGTHDILSLSPELFFEKRGSRVTTRPMKGTAPRGRWRSEDEAARMALVNSEKERAENVMIVDLLRNDLGRIATRGSVRASRLYEAERYPSLWQLTSTVEAEVPPGVGVRAIFGALFPSGSVTGAPKIRSGEVIARLEGVPRGVYTGAIGYVRPGGDCIFNVAIRTIVIDRRTGRATLGVGAGITIDSEPEKEYHECLLKAAFSRADHEAPFSLLETMRLESGNVIRLDRHLRRMADSAVYFGYAWDDRAIRSALDVVCAGHRDGRWRLRLTVDAAGRVQWTCGAFPQSPASPWRVAVAGEPIDTCDPLLFNKTTDRRIYEAARRARPDVDDVLLWNDREEMTESTVANLVVDCDGVMVTPPSHAGLLPGTYRAELLEAGVLREQAVSRQELRRARRIWLVNSLRGWIDAVLVT
jgi:para-aminobenzoate synthetase/4-amino-4-deoxychorismate lyase